MIVTAAPPHFLDILNGRSKDLDSSSFSYKLAPNQNQNQFALDVISEEPEVDESRMSAWLGVTAFGNYSPYRSSTHSVFFGDLFLTHSLIILFSYFFSFNSGKSGVWMTFADKASTVLQFVFLVFLFCSPAKIIAMVVRRVSVYMKAFHSFWTRTDEGKEYEMVYVVGFLFRIVYQGNGFVLSRRSNHCVFKFFPVFGDSPSPIVLTPDSSVLVYSVKRELKETKRFARGRWEREIFFHRSSPVKNFQIKKSWAGGSGCSALRVYSPSPSYFIEDDLGKLRRAA